MVGQVRVSASACGRKEDLHASSTGDDPQSALDLAINARLRELSVPNSATTPPGWEGLTADLRVFEFRLYLGRVTAPLPELHTLRVDRFTRDDATAFIALPKLASLTVRQQNGDWVGLVSKRDRPLAELRVKFNPSPRAADSLFRREWFQQLRVFAPSGDEERMRAACASARHSEPKSGFGVFLGNYSSCRRDNVPALDQCERIVLL